jgi:hypothetical protein
MTTPQVIIIVKRTSYTEAQKRATQKWNQAHPEKLREYRMRTYYKKREQERDFVELARLSEAAVHPEFRKKRHYVRRSKTSSSVESSPTCVIQTEPEQCVVALQLEESAASY